MEENTSLILGKNGFGDFSGVKYCANKLKLECILIGTEFAQVHKQVYSSTDKFSEFLKEKPIKNKTILLKGSRGITLEKLVKLL